ncbi:uncharacterized protein LOC125489231 [Plutella xylostella]|uniref:uncharacterized protein LOC125489231 n=1 Tax=Plutella xylostella TaxID=51655 RepID=UPI002032CE4B|nr:uncharacterized protein LOC125489231 [Plutella xylostella]
MHVGCRIDNTSVNNISYADDMVLLSPSVRALRKLLGACESYAAEHGLRYNATKSELMVFKAGSKCPAEVPPVVLGGAPLKRVKSFKYLGHIVTEDLSDDADMERERRALAIRANMIAHSLWSKYTRKSFSALRVQYNNSLRVLLRLGRRCSASGMFAAARTDCFYTVLRKRCASTLARLRSSCNSILDVIADSLSGETRKALSAVATAARPDSATLGRARPQS